MTRYVLDTNIFTAILRHESEAAQRVKAAQVGENEFLLCPAVFLEVLRGLLHRDSKKQLGFFLNCIAPFTWEDFNRNDWELAAQLWANLRALGQQISDIDLLIGVYADRRQAVIVTDNEKDFTPLGVKIENKDCRDGRILAGNWCIRYILP